MKRIYILSVCLLLAGLIFTSCLKEYLDKAPESGLSESEVFTKYSNILDYFDQVYEDGEGKASSSIITAFPHHWSQADQKFSLDCLTDQCDAGRLQGSQQLKGGNFGTYTVFLDYNDLYGRRGWFMPLWRATRIANKTLANINRVKDATLEDKYDLIAQAYFVRGFCLFELFRGWGPMPHITKALTAEDFPWDYARPTKNATCMFAVADLDSAIAYFNKAKRMRRDAGPGEAGHLNSPDQFRPNGVAAVAYRARILLYAASPLNNERGIEEWEIAAKANWDAIALAEQHQYSLLSAAEYKKNWVGVKYSNEAILQWYSGSYPYTNVRNTWLIPGVIQGSTSTNSSSNCPTQNHVDQYETRWGDPLNTEGDRAKAAALGHYNEQDPYKDRDPRFYVNIIYNQAPLAGFQSNKAQIFYQIVAGKPQYSELLQQNYRGVTLTGYYQRKRWGENSVKNKVNVLDTDPVIRLAELYLNYAEAANEAYGPHTPGPGANMTAVQAVNKVRNRMNMPDVQAPFSVSKEIFRDRIKNERSVELSFEGHRYYDLRRWMDAPVINSSPIYGMDVEKVATSPVYPTGYRYTRYMLPSNRQMVWKEPMYYFCFSNSIYNMVQLFDTYERW